MKHTIQLRFYALGVALLIALYVAPVTAAEPTTLPLLDDEAIIRVPVTLFGETRYFAVDTGAPVTIIDASYRARLVAEAGVNRAATRLKLWKLEMRVLAYLCAEWTIQLLLPPAEAQTAEGFLKPEYYANDATHANAAYGELVLRQLEAVAVAISPVQETA